MEFCSCISFNVSPLWILLGKGPVFNLHNKKE